MFGGGSAGSILLRMYNLVRISFRKTGRYIMEAIKRLATLKESDEYQNVDWEYSTKMPKTDNFSVLCVPVSCRTFLPYITTNTINAGSILAIRTGVVYTFIFMPRIFMTVLPLPPIDSVTPGFPCMYCGAIDAVRRVIF